MNEFIKVTVYVSQYHKKKLDNLSAGLQIPIARLVAIALDHELKRDDGFKFNTELPSQKLVEFAYAEESGKILKYMIDKVGFSIGQFLILRHDIGIADEETMLHALKECVDKKYLEPYEKKASVFIKTLFEPEIYYRLKGSGTKAKVKARKKASRFQRFQRDKKEFEGI